MTTVPIRQLHFDITMLEGAWEIRCETCAARIAICVLRTVDHMMTRIRGHVQETHMWRPPFGIKFTKTRQVDVTRSCREAYAFQTSEEEHASNAHE